MWEKTKLLGQFDTSVLPYMLMCIDLNKYADMILDRQIIDQNSAL